jgi:lipoprotein-anchoring transpeptidase ErfK/SrfK
VGRRTTATLLVALTAVAALAAGSARATASDACPATPAAPAASLTVAYPVTAALVGPANAAVAALVDAGGAQAQFLVEYGATSDYGLCTAAVAVPTGTGAQSVGVVIAGLTPSTTYHFRVLATGAAGSTAGADEVLTTLPAGEIPQGTTINGIQVGGLTRSDATAAVRRVIAAPARLALGSKRWTVPRTKLGVRLDAAGAVASALAATPGQALQAPITVNTRTLRRYLRAAGDRYGEPAQAPTVALVGRHAVVTKPRHGIALAVDRAVPAVQVYLQASRTQVLRVPSRRLRAPRTGGPKAVVIRLGSQTLTAYVGSKVVLTTPVTTGRPALPTPVGSYAIQGRYSPFTFISPWPEGSPYWYPPAPVTWAMPFYDGDFLHDDPGEPEGAYGAGSQNGPYASHGCVHVPHDAMAFLFRWLPIGATVIVADS